METKELVAMIDQSLSPIGFKRKGNFWLINGVEITKMVNLQKSQHSGSFYINYGYILEALPLDGMIMHVYNRLTSPESEEREKIASLLDIDQVILYDERKSQLTDIILRNMVDEMVDINTEADLLEKLRNRPHLNDIPLIVKRRLKLPID